MKPEEPTAGICVVVRPRKPFNSGGACVQIPHPLQPAAAFVPLSLSRDFVYCW